MTQETVFLIIVGMTVVTYGPRFLPLWLLSSRSLPPMVVTYLKYVPVAVLSSMLFPAILCQDGGFHLALDNYFIWAALPALLTAVLTRSLFGSVLVGMAIVAGARFWLGM